MAVAMVGASMPLAATVAFVTTFKRQCFFCLLCACVSVSVRACVRVCVASREPPDLTGSALQRYAHVCGHVYEHVYWHVHRQELRHCVHVRGHMCGHGCGHVSGHATVCACAPVRWDP